MSKLDFYFRQSRKNRSIKLRFLTNTKIVKKLFSTYRNSVVLGHEWSKHSLKVTIEKRQHIIIVCWQNNLG